MPYVTKTEIEFARQVDLLTFLKLYNPNELIPIGNNSYKTRTHDSLKISNGKWCWWSHERTGGKNALEYLIKVNNMPFPEAVQLINSVYGFSDINAKVYKQTEKTNINTPSPFILPAANSNNNRVTTYLLNRGIDMEIIDFCYKNHLLYEDQNFHNAVFVGYDGAEPKYAFMRGTGEKRFMREVTGSKKEHSFLINGSSETNVLNVFECTIDAISYMTLIKSENKNLQSESFLSLGGVFKTSEKSEQKLPPALSHYLESHKNISEIILRLDNDEVGISASKGIASAIKNIKVTIIPPPKCKDYNEYLMFKKGIDLKSTSKKFLKETEK